MVDDSLTSFQRDMLGDPPVRARADRWIEKWGAESGHAGANCQVAFGEELWS